MSLEDHKVNETKVGTYVQNEYKRLKQQIDSDPQDIVYLSSTTVHKLHDDIKQSTHEICINSGAGLKHDHSIMEAIDAIILTMYGRVYKDYCIGYMGTAINNALLQDKHYIHMIKPTHNDLLSIEWDRQV